MQCGGFDITYCFQELLTALSLQLVWAAVGRIYNGDSWCRKWLTGRSLLC